MFASGNGSNFQVIAEQFPVEFVFSDHRDAYVLERAKNLGVASHAFELKEFDNKEAYGKMSQELLADLRQSPGSSAVVIYLKDVKAIKKLPVGYHVQIQPSWMNQMYEKYGQTNVKVVERGLKNL